MKLFAADYKGKWFVLCDELGDDIERPEIDLHWVVGEGLRDHVKNCMYYGIPAYIGTDKELKKRIGEIESEL